MHRTETKDPKFGPIVYGEIWVRVREDDNHYRHFHVAPPTDSTGNMDRMSVEQAMEAVRKFNATEREQAHLFDYYAVRVETQRTMLGEISMADTSLAAMFAEKAEREIEEGRGSPRPSEVVGKWSIDFFHRSHRIVSAMYVGMGTVGRSYCGLININTSLRAYLVDEPPENACRSCLGRTR